MKTFFVLLMCTTLFGCNTVQVGQIDTAIQKTAPQVCEGVQVAHAAFLATGLGSEKDKQSVETAYAAVASLCQNPSTITATQLVVVTAQTGIIIAAMRRVKVNG